MMPQRWFMVGTLLTPLFALVVPCLAATPTPRPEGTLTVAVATFGNERWLPHLYVGAEDVVLKPMFENLLNRDPKTGELTPMLAERWEVLDGGRTWTFHLRKGVMFHRGQGEMTAEDVKFTFTAIAKEGSANGLSPEFRLITSMEIEDPSTITLRFEKPFVSFGNKVTQGLFASSAFIHSKRYIEAMGEKGAERQPVATGPWKFVEHIRGDRIVYEAVEDHWRAVPQFKRLVFLKVPEPATRMAMLQAGSVDVIEIGGEYVEELKSVGVRTLTMPNVSWLIVILGGQWPSKPTYDPKVPWALPDAERARKVRLALNLAVDKQVLLQRVLGGPGTALGAWLTYPTDPWATEELLPPYPYDPAKAKQLLAEAGYPNGFDAGELTPNPPISRWGGRRQLPGGGGHSDETAHHGASSVSVGARRQAAAGPLYLRHQALRQRRHAHRGSGGQHQDLRLRGLSRHRRVVQAAGRRDRPQQARSAAPSNPAAHARARDVRAYLAVLLAERLLPSSSLQYNSAGDTPR